MAVPDTKESARSANSLPGSPHTVPKTSQGKPDKKPKKDSGKKKIREFLIANVGKTLTTKQISEVSGIIAHARRVRELRDDEGMQIWTDKDRHDLKPGEYLLESLECKVPEKGISPKLRIQVLERDGYTCQLCGATAGDPSTYNPNRKVRLHVDHIVPNSQQGEPKLENLRTLCSDCNQGRSNIQAPSETAKNILARIRKLPRAQQTEVYAALKRSFPTALPAQAEADTKKDSDTPLD
jgi:hypothetical protein